MRLRSLVSIALVILVGIGSALACGDKLLFMGNGINLALIIKSAHPATVLIYMNPGSQLPAADKEVQLQDVLKRAGHKARPIASRAEFLQTLTTGGYDVVVTDIADARTLKSDVETASGKPALVPVLYKASKDQVAVAQKQFGCPVKADRNNSILKTIDEVMKNKQKGIMPQCHAL